MGATVDREWLYGTHCESSQVLGFLCKSDWLDKIRRDGEVIYLVSVGLSFLPNDIFKNPVRALSTCGDHVVP